MELLPLRLFCQSGNWQSFFERTKSKNYQKIKEIILSRDQDACRYCGYHSKKNDLVNLDHNYSHNTQENIVLACKICVQVLLFDGHGLSETFSGKMIYLPEIQQVDLNHFLRVLYATKTRQPSFQSRLSDVLINLDERKDQVEALFGKTSSEAKNFSQGLLDLFIDEKKIRHELLKSIKFLPDKSTLEDEFEDYIDYYFDD
jgi:hypothetical protein